MHRKRMAVNISAAILSMLLLVVSAPVSLAAAVAARIPVSQEFTANRPNVDDRFQYVLKALTQDAPMPAGSSAGKFIFTMEGTEDILLEIPMEPYIKAEYTIYQKIASSQKNYTYDKSRYKIILTSYMDDKHQTAVTVTIENSKGEKAESAHFTNQYYKTSNGSTPGVPGTGDTNRIFSYSTAMAGSFVLMLLLFVWDRRWKEEETYEEE